MNYIGRRVKMNGHMGTIDHYIVNTKSYHIVFDNKNLFPPEMDISEGHIELYLYSPFDTRRKCDCGAQAVAKSKRHYKEPSIHEHAHWCNVRD